MTGRSLYMHHAWLYAAQGEFVVEWDELTDVSKQVWNTLALQFTRPCSKCETKEGEHAS